MNRISIKTCLNKFSGENYYDILVDNIPLETHALKRSPNDITPGLVSTFLNWLSDPQEQEIVWKRALPEGYSKVNLPILMCGDDIDLWCDVIIAEVEVDDDYVYWNKLGLDNSTFENTAASIGTTVDWFPGKPFIFDRKEYENVLSSFKKYLTDDFTGKVYQEITS